MLKRRVRCLHRSRAKELWVEATEGPELLRLQSRCRREARDPCGHAPAKRLDALDDSTDTLPHAYAHGS